MVYASHGKRILARILVLGIMLLASNGIRVSNAAAAQSPRIHAVLFYSPSCAHCHKVITEDLPPLIEKYGDQLYILGVDVNTQEGQALYQTAVQQFNIPQERLGVPCLIVGETVLVGSAEIPQLFPGIIEQGLALGGIAWPNIPGLENAVPTEAPAETTGSENNPPAIEQDITFVQRFQQDPLGNSLAVIVLIGMLASLVVIGYHQRKPHKSAPWPTWSIPLLVSVGLLVAAYLSYVEVTQSTAVCGPVGDCNAVQQSPYARLFGILPIGVLGILGYLGVGVAWFISRSGPIAWRRPALLLVFWGAVLGVLFSIYLTFLEPFVIGATCAWCLTSAIVMTLLLWATAPLIGQLSVRKRRPDL